MSFETAAGNQIRNVLVQNASTGIVQTSIQNSNMTSLEPNIFENIRNIGTMTEEVIQIAAGGSSVSFSRNIIRGVDFKTNLSNPYYTSYAPRYYAIVAAASGSSNNFLKIKDSIIDLVSDANFWFVLDQIPRLGLDGVDFYDNGTVASTRFIHSEGSTVPSFLGLNSVSQNFGQSPLDLSTSLQFLNSTAGITAKISDRGLPYFDSGTLFSSAQPTYPTAPYWNTNLRVERIMKAAGSFEGWTNVSGAWKTYGTVSA